MTPLLLIVASLAFVHGQIMFPDVRFPEKPGFVFNEESVRRVDSINLISRREEVHVGMNKFMLGLNKVMMSRQPDENVVLSPLSLAGAMSMLLLGSMDKTYEELANALGFFNDISRSKFVHKEFGNLLGRVTRRIPSEYSDGLRNLSYASAIFLQNDYPLNQQYQSELDNIYKSFLIQLDFENHPENAQWAVNRWIYDQTYGKIRNIMQSVPPRDTKLILASALYFKAEWERHFIDGQTRRVKFTPDKRYPDEQIQVDMMGTEGFFPYFKSTEHECMIVGLPYKGNKTTLYAIKPTDSLRKSLKQLLNSMTADTLESLIRNARRQSTLVLFPRMKLTAAYNLKTFLEDMGVRSVFSKSQANLAHIVGIPNQSKVVTEENEDRLIFTRIGGDAARRRIKREVDEFLNPGLYVDEVVHKVDIDITEKGTEAAAATAIFITKSGLRPIFTADEPFFFLIRDEETGLSLFSAVVNRPYPNYQ